MGALRAYLSQRRQFPIPPSQFPITEVLELSFLPQNEVFKSCGGLRIRPFSYQYSMLSWPDPEPLNPMSQPATERIDSCDYEQRNPHASHYYRCVEAHFEELAGVWDDRYAGKCGFWRPYTFDVI